MKKGFTLIELLAVVIILAIVALIATPIILNVIEDARNSADMSSAQLIVNEGHNYYAGAMLDEVKQEDIELEKDIYDKLNINNKPEIGQLYVNKENKVAMAIIINNKCYKKTYYSEIEVVENVDCDLGYMGPDDIKPTVNQKVINTSVNENDWYKEDMYIEIEVKDNESGPAGYKRCMGQDECEPEETIYKLENKIYINTESATNYVCVIGIDNKGNESEKNCINYKLDKTIPNIEGIGDKVVQKDEVVDLKEGVIVNDTLSGIDGQIIIEPSSIDTSITGTKQVKYKVKDKAGNEREVIRNIIIDAESPTIVYNLVNPSSINSNGWAKENFYVRATITDNSGSGIKVAKSCTSNSSSECIPTADISGTTKDFYIEVEGNNRLCIEVTDNNNKTTKICSDTYKLDKTAPIAGTATFAGTLGSNAWYTSDVTVNVVNGSDSLSGHLSTTSNISSITSNTTGTTVTITTTDLAGNSASRSYTIKLDKNSPTLTDKGGSVTIYQGDSYVVSNYFNVGYSISGGNISCNPVNTNSLGVGTQTVSCTATGGNGKSVTTSKQITVKAKPVSFATDSWETIADAVKNNNTSMYNVGDTKEVTVSGYSTFTVRIANKSTPSECNTAGFSQTACGFVVEFVDIITTYKMNSPSTNSGGWPASEMYNFVNNNIYNALPSELKSVIIDTYSVSGHGSGESSNLVSENDKLYLLSTKEVWGKEGTSRIVKNDSAEAETRQLDYYKNIGVTTDSYSGAVKTYQGIANWWWLRTAYSTFSLSFYSVHPFGDCRYASASNSYGVAPAFRIG